MEKLYVFCDGGCRGNQYKFNIGGWGVVLEYKDFTKEFYGNTKNTTNNIMELTSCIEALKQIKRKDIPVVVTMDSQYVVKGVNEWIHSWVRNGWCNTKKKPVENKELWQTLLELKKSFKDITFVHCKGHSNNKGNNRADKLANIAMDEINTKSVG